MRFFVTIGLILFSSGSFAATTDCSKLTSVDALTPPPTPSAIELKTRLDQLRSDLERYFPKYLEENYANCTVKRAELRVNLLDSSKDQKTRDAVLASIVRPEKFPTLISALADARVLTYGLEKRIWRGSSNALVEAQALQQKIKNELAEENKIYGVAWGNVIAGLKERKNEESQTKFLRESADFKKLRSHLLREPDDAAKYLTEIQSLARGVRE